MTQPSADYVLSLSESELRRYQVMAAQARVLEADLWDRAGIASGAAVADVGCGPAATAVAMAQVVGPSGSVVGVERDPDALAQARSLVAAGGVSNVTLRAGEAARTGLEPGSVDVAVMRHVLAHNGSHELEIVRHLAEVVRPGGWVYLVDVDLTGFRVLPMDPRLADMSARYAEFHTGIGNDPMIGLRLGNMLRDAGLVDVEHHGRFSIFPAPPGLRPPPWVAREAMVAAGTISADDADRWTTALEAMDASEERPTVFIAQFFALGRRPSVP
ncbi:MAG: methyltransferase domain-containing protein [Actinomycetota bacterium]|nr:methyltransferase domain-containing protein [Actinomycetota bacterium]